MAIDIVSRLTLNARQFIGQFDQAINQATARARSGGRVIGEGLTDEVNGRLQDFAGRIPVVGGALAALSGPALAAAGGIGAITTALGFAVAEADGYAKEAAKLDNVLRATGNTTALTAEQLRDYADELETATAIGAEEFLAAERQLASFGGIAGTTFREVIALSADLAATFGGDVVSNSEKLGTVLQNLAAGDVDGLARGFKFLGKETIASIEALAQAGQTYEAQIALIDALRRRVGGAAGAGADNLAGDFFRLSDAIGDASRSLAEQSGLYDAVRRGVQGVTSDLNAYIERLKTMPSAGQVVDLATGALSFVVPGARISRGMLPTGNPGAAQPGAGVSQADFDAAGNRLAEERAARASAASAKAEGDKRRAAEAAAVALERQRAAAKAAAESAARQARAVAELIDDLKFQASIAGKTREEQQRLTQLRQLDQRFGAALTPELRAQAALLLDMAQRAKDIAEARADMLANWSQQAQADFAAGQAQALEVALADDGEFSRAVKQMIDVLNEQIPKLDSVFDKAGRVFEDFARNLKDTLQNAIGSLGDRIINQTVGRVFDVAFKPIQSILDTILGPLENTSGIGALGGAAAGFAAGGPIGALVGALTGGGLESLIFGRDPYADAFLNITDGRVGTSRIAARGKDRQEQAVGLAQAVGEGLTNLANVLGGRLSDTANLGAIGSNKGTFYFNPTGGDFRAAGRQSFATAEEAVAAALRNAVANGAISGVDETVKRLLASGDLETQLAKAAALANALRAFDQAANPFADAVASLNDEFEQLRDIMAEAGASAAQLNQASGEYDRRLQAIKDSAMQATSTLRGFLESLGFGSASPLSLGEQRSAALAAYQAQVGRIGQNGFDQQAFTAAGQRLLEIEGQLFGRTDSFFATFRQVQDDTNRAIAAIDRAASITGDNPFARATADNTAATAANTAAVAEAVINLPGLLGGALARALAELGLSPTDAARGFVFSEVAA